ncbi:YndJ family protein [Ornithinibacillus halophilus]|uniref:YndJ-like protein n=1 Tax=Ornithinibacillus halophilus TaxID=930117 RepID=A0A1M5FJM9_9BACI|nr:YndJ family protein [Ornithinibacillus halophilus]SHF91629.1 YndJ-like protein [Ornithinibacillus halophilus]
MTFRNIGLCNILLLIFIGLFGINPWYELLLTVAQIVFVPLVLHLVIDDENKKNSPKYLVHLTIVASLAVFLSNFIEHDIFNVILTLTYFIFTLGIAWYGLRRLLQRGLIQIEECMIDFGLMFIAMGGAWFVAYKLNIDTGFSTMLTWLTAIHFHYSAFLLPIFLGFLGRIYSSKAYNVICVLILVSPIIVALGITFSTTIELLSVLIYIVGIYSLILFSYKATFRNHWQKWFIRVSFMALGITILFSLVYAFGNFSNNYTITIDFMLRFHGLINVGAFAAVGLIGWYIDTPEATSRNEFPISRLTGNFIIGDHFIKNKTDKPKYQGLVDNMANYYPDVDVNLMAAAIRDFYENTNSYRLFAKVQWYKWFLPFAFAYRLVSKRVKQINLPLSSKQVEMTGDIYSVSESLDGRPNPRAWVRKINNETVFVALYSYHHSEEKQYMNIALPLPFSTMIGILELEQVGNALRLTSKRRQNTHDSGIYLAIHSFLMKLPIEEDFIVKETAPGILEASHKMWIFSIPFLSIQYVIRKKSVE